MSLNTYFLGGNTPAGFRSAFDDVIGDTDYYTYIIKGGPGTGKSSLMKKILAAFPDEDRELYICSSDPDSADAVVLKEHKVIIVDGTAPHVYDPEYPGAVQEIVNLGDCWNGGKLRSEKDGVIAATKGYKQFHARCRRCLAAAASVIGDTAQIAETALNFGKLDGFISRLSAKLLPQKPVGEGRTVLRRISAVTPKGCMTLIPENDTIYLLNDSYYAGTDYFLRSLAENAVRKGLTAEISVSALHEDEFFEHMRIPELNVSFISSNSVCSIILEEKIPVNFMRFYSKDVLSAKKARLKFNAAAASELTEEAVKALANAKTAHDKLEEFYIDAVDFGKTEKICKTLIAEIKSGEKTEE